MDGETGESMEEEEETGVGCGAATFAGSSLSFLTGIIFTCNSQRGWCKNNVTVCSHAAFSRDDQPLI